MTRACSICTAPIGDTNASGLCRPCVARRNSVDPALNERRRAGILKRLSDPEIRSAHVARCIANGRDITDEVREKRRLRGKDNIPHLRAANAALSPEIRKENGRKRTATALAWCPEEWRPTYLSLTKRGRKAAVAKRIVLDMIAGKPLVMYAQQKAQLAWLPEARRKDYEELRRYLGAADARKAIEAEMTPFERQLQRVRMGAKLTTVPDTRPTGPAYSLVGNATGML